MFSPFLQAEGGAAKQELFELVEYDLDTRSGAVFLKIMALESMQVGRI